jgi:7,8-dihydro-6-hydroxymethylpterin-pyrophosphokinase
LVETELSPSAVLETIKSIEIELGRKKRDKWTAREIDIDIVFYNLEVLQTESLTIPHPEMANRNFA